MILHVNINIARTTVLNVKGNIAEIIVLNAKTDIANTKIAKTMNINVDVKIDTP